jgi:hypothetical protein
MPKYLLRICLVAFLFTGILAGCSDDIKPLKVDPIEIPGEIPPDKQPKHLQPGGGSSANYQKYNKPPPTSGKVD